jgi:hypothetical protein
LTESNGAAASSQTGADGHEAVPERLAQTP